MELIDFKCKNCDPTCFNPKFHTQCKYCVKNSSVTIYKHTALGPSEYEMNGLYVDKEIKKCKRIHTKK